MTTCACGGIVVQLPGWVRALDGYYTLTDVSPPLAAIDLRTTSTGALRWDVTVCGKQIYDERAPAACMDAATAFQAAMMGLAALHRQIDDALVAFLVENGRADECRDEAACQGSCVSSPR